ncbi:MAG: radical SAM protein [Deltaproteobacteria bacterium]|nr:radical SAM protein [Deltaproteobacteria bacterium]
MYVKHYEEFITSHGATLTFHPQEADILLVDTCATNQLKEDESLGLIKQHEAIAKEGSKVIVCGCLAGINPKRLQEHFKGEFFSPKNEKQLAQILCLDEEDAKLLTAFDPRGRFMGGDYTGASKKFRFLVRLCTLFHKIDHFFSLNWVPVFGKFLSCTQAANPYAYAISISQGCLGNCSFCVIPMAKGRTVSLPLALITDKIRIMVEKGVKKIILTSEDTGAYGSDIGISIIDLLKQIHKIPGDFELYIHYFDPRWLRLYGHELKVLLAQRRIQYLQLALQSGDNEILKRMKRAYLIDQVLPFIEDFRKSFPRLAMSTQIITGFPGETQAQFENSKSLLKKRLFDNVDVFAFSNRPGADTNTIPGHLEDKIIQERRRVLQRQWQWAKLFHLFSASA